MNKKAIIIWAILFCGGFGSGYWLDELANQRTIQRTIRAKFIESIGWAISEGIITVNQDRLAEMDGDGLEENCITNDTTNADVANESENTDTNTIIGSGMEQPPSRNP